MFIEMTKRPYRMAKRAESRDQTRARIVRALRLLRNKKDTNPARKHGNIPL